MAEVTLLAALRNLGLGLAAMADQPVFAKLSALVSLFLVTVASSVGGEAGMAILAPLAGFAVTGTFWLMLHYWKRLDIPAASRLALGAALPLERSLDPGSRRRARGAGGDRAVACGHRAHGPGAHVGRHRLERPRGPFGRRRRRPRSCCQRTPRIGRVHRERSLSGDRPSEPLRRLQRVVRRAVQAEEDGEDDRPGSAGRRRAEGAAG